MRISARNQIRGTIREVKKGATTAHVLVDIGDTDIGGPLITASITNESVDELGLKVGSSVCVVVKASTL
jgi:molybdopterin-binding protein